jgi:hypothetical protein
LTPTNAFIVAGWAHVVCALYIPEVRFGNVTTMDPIILSQVPADRFNKVRHIFEYFLCKDLIEKLALLTLLLGAECKQTTGVHSLLQM